MKNISIQYCSDLHLEFSANTDFMRDNPIIPKADILLLAGDIVPLKYIDKCDWFWDKISADFKQVYWVPGNHEYYTEDLKNYKGSFNRRIRDNINLVNNVVVVDQDIRLIFSTLWSKIREENRWRVEERLSDFSRITNDDYVFTADYYDQLHEECLAFIINELKKEHKGKTVVCTHHVPTFLNYPEIYRGSVINEAFATELFPIIEELKPDAWVYGHSHYNQPPFTIGETQMISNQLGYIKHNENGLYRRDLVYKTE